MSYLFTFNRYNRSFAYPIANGILGLLIAFLFIPQSLVMANEISDFHKFAWSENSGWLNFKTTHARVQVFNDHLEGYIWAENVGWIRLGTYEGGGSHTYLNSSASDYGVNNDGEGNLSGYGWGENIGWVNFNPSHSQVTIDPFSGDFDGYAWSENMGWIHFKNASPEYRVTQTTNEAETIPLALDLTDNATLNEFQNTVEVVGSGNQLNLSQNTSTGMLTASVNNNHYHMRPIHSTQLSGTFTPGIILDEDGLINIIGAQGTQLTVLAEPLQVDQLFSALSAMGFESEQQNFGMIKVESTLNQDSPNIWYAVRPAYESIATNTQTIQALTTTQAEKPQNTVLFEHNFLAGGVIYKQVLYPTPADWERLKVYLSSFGQVSIDLQGTIRLKIGNQMFEAITDYKVEPSDQRLGQVELLNTQDLNGDGSKDFQIIYPNGDMQFMYLLP